jgi:hypothetical protein
MPCSQLSGAAVLSRSQGHDPEQNAHAGKESNPLVNMHCSGESAGNASEIERLA